MEKCVGLRAVQGASCISSQGGGSGALPTSFGMNMGQSDIAGLLSQGMSAAGLQSLLQQQPQQALPQHQQPQSQGLPPDVVCHCHNPMSNRQPACHPSHVIPSISSMTVPCR